MLSDLTIPGSGITHYQVYFIFLYWHSKYIILDSSSLFYTTIQMTKRRYQMYGSLVKDDTRLVHFHTGTPYDLMTGKYEIGIDGKFYLNGGYAQYITGLHGRGNTYKSTLLDSMLVGLARIYNDAYVFDFDTEASKDKNRIVGFMNDVLHTVAKEPINKRIVLKMGGKWTISELWKFVNKLMEKRKSDIKKHKVMSPFLGYDLEAIEIFRPLIIIIDTLSELKSTTEIDLLSGSKDIEDKKNRTIYMEDGNKKTVIMSALNKFCNLYGITVCTTAHTGDNFSMDSITPPKKQLLDQKQNDKIKGVGSKYTTLTHVLTQVLSCKHAQDSTKKALYPLGETSDKDLQELIVIIGRNKVQSSGMAVPFIVSQTYGLLPNTTNLHFLRTNGYVGLDGGPSKPTHACVWYPDQRFSRKNFRERVAKDYKLARAIELVSRYRYIQLCWNHKGQPFDISKTPEEVFKQIIEKKLLDRILESTGYWTYDKSDREYLSLYEILRLINE